MKHSMLIVLFCLSTFSSAQANRAEGSSILAIEFVSYGHYAVNLLQSTVLPGGNHDKVLKVLAETKVVSTGDLCFQNAQTGENVCYETIYDKSKSQITFSVRNWNEMSCPQKLAISAHEYLKALGLESNSYRYSQLLINKDKSNNTTHSVIRREVSSWCK